MTLSNKSNSVLTSKKLLAVVDKFMNQNELLLRDAMIRKKCVSFVEEILILKEKFRMVALDLRKASTGDVFEEKLYKILNDFFEKAALFEKAIPDEILNKRLKKLFRQITKDDFCKSKLIRHGIEKPQGYPGDYQIVEAMYVNKVLTTSGVGHYLDKYFLTNAYVQAVRDRKDSMRLFLTDFINSSQLKSLKILNLACGSSRDVFELLSENSFAEKEVGLTLLDQDRDALEFSSKRLKKIKNNINIKYVVSDFVKFLKLELSAKKNTYNMIYSIGLADYLPDSILGLMFKFGFELLDNGGQLVIAHKNTFHFKSPISDWGADWKFIERTKADLSGLIKKYLGDNKYRLSFVRIPNQLIFYVIVTKLPIK